MIKLTLEPGDIRAAIIAIETVRDSFQKQETKSFMCQMAIEKFNETLRAIRVQLPPNFKET